MKKLLILILFSVWLLSCTKEREQNPNCQNVLCLSYKYSLNDTTRLLRIDTTDHLYLCDSTLQAFKMAADTLQNRFKLCGDNELEKLFYIYK